MRRALLALPLLLLAAPPALPQELSPANLDRLKAATVYVKAVHPTATITSSGFLFLVRGSDAYVLTCTHNLGNEAKLQVVFRSGESTELECAATEVGRDEDLDLSCLLVKDARGLPVPLDVGDKTTVRETTTVYAAGFPFGQAMAAGKGNAQVAVTSSQVTSFRRNAGGFIIAVQLAGEINPGESGGPVVDADCKVIGMACVRIGGTQTWFALPPESIQHSLMGRPKSTLVKSASATETTAKMEVDVELLNPLGALKDVGISYVWEDQMTGEPKRETSGSWGKVSTLMKDAALPVTGERAGATLEVTRTASEPISRQILFQLHWTHADGTQHWDAPAAVEALFAEGADAGVELATADQLKQVGLLRLTSAIAGLCLTKDGAYLYALNLSDCKVLQIEASTLKVAHELQVPDNTTAMCLTPDESTIYVVTVEKPGGAIADEGTGILEGIATKDLKATGTWSIPLAPRHVAATDRGVVIVSGGIQTGSSGFVLDVNSKRQAERILTESVGWIHVAPDQARLYSGEDRGGSGGNYLCVPLQRAEDGWKADASIRVDQAGHEGRGEFGITPDGRLLIGSLGTVWRLATTRLMDLRHVGEVPPFVSIGMASGCNRFFLSTREGYVKEYAFRGLEMKKSFKVDGICTCLALDAKRRVLYAHLARVANGGQSISTSRVGVGNIVAWTLSGK